MHGMCNTVMQLKENLMPSLIIS